VVKRQRRPVRGSLATVVGERRRRLDAGAGCMAMGRDRRHVSAPPTSCGAIAPAPARAARPRGGPRRPRNPLVPSSRPRQRGGCTVPVRQCGPGAGAGPPRPADATLGVAVGVGAGVQSRQREPGERPRRSAACQDAVSLPRRRAGGRLSPEASREAAGSPAPRQPSLRHASRANAAARCSRSETARATAWASAVRALPCPRLWARRARHGWPAGGCRQHRTAASEQAQ
jgi:hypothetical protein